MRISDWSSDVCSSDLIGDDSNRASLDAPKTTDDVACMGGLHFKEVALVHCFADQLMHVIGLIGIGRDQHVQAFLDPVRSEEHTSELQSLMRISYAVFCLKKKT